MTLRSPISLRPLHQTGHALVAGGERWPVVADIAFLRADRRDLADAALAALDDGDTEGALVLLLSDQDHWALTPPPDETALRHLVRNQATLSFRAAMDLLALGPVSTYFAHRWSDPTFLSGLALAQSHWRSPGCVVELACGAGHYLRAFTEHANTVIGCDLVFAKLWLARHYLSPDATLLCFDAAAPWPLPDDAADLLFCHDAFYFLANKPQAAAEMQRVTPRILLGHMHNALVDNLSSGAPLDPAGYAALFSDPTLFDDRELTAAFVEARAPVASNHLADAPAIALTSGAGAPGPATGVLAVPPTGTKLRRNPLYVDGTIVWPSARYAAEYGALATYPVTTDAPERALAGADPLIDAMALRRVLVDLPECW